MLNGDAPKVKVEDAEVFCVDLENFILNYDENQFFKPVMNAMDSDRPIETKRKLQPEKILYLFEMNGKELCFRGLLFIQENLCRPYCRPHTTPEFLMN